MNDNVYPFPTPAKPEEVLDIAKSAGFKDVLVVGWDTNDDLVIIGSDMTPQDMLFMMALAQREILE